MADAAVLDLLPEAVVVVAPDGRVTLVNERAGPLLGLDTQAVGRPLADVLELREPGGQRWNPPAAPQEGVAGVGRQLEEHILEVGGPRGGRRVTVAGRWSDDGVLVVTARDGVSDTASGAGASPFVAELVAALAHDLRSPLTSVKGFTRTLLARWERFDDDQRRAMLETIDADADRVARLLQQLVEVGRVVAGRVRLRLEPVDLGDLLHALAGDAARWGEARGRTVTVEVDRELPRVPADPARLEVALGALVEEALRSHVDAEVVIAAHRAADGVHITVATSPAESEAPPSEPVRRSQGIGPAGAATAGDTRSTLVNLLVRGLIEAHGGAALGLGDEAPGSVVEIRLPGS